MAKRQTSRKPKTASGINGKRQRADEALRESEERFRALVEFAPVAIVVVDHDGRIVLVNAGTEELFGYGRDELVGQPLEILLPARLRTGHAGHRADYFSAPRLRAMGELLDLVARRKDGSEFPIDCALSFVELGGGVLGMAFATDITERKQAEEALRESEGRFIRVNRALVEASGIPREVLEGGSAFDLFPEHAEEYWQDDKEVMASGQAKSNIIEPMGTAEGTRWYRTDKIPYVDANGAIAGIIGFSADITELKLAEAALERAREELEGRVERQMVRRNPYGLTFREFTVLHLVAAGRANKEIAGELGISPLTVSKHVGNILGKMDAASRTDAAVRASREGLLD